MGGKNKLIIIFLVFFVVKLSRANKDYWDLSEDNVKDSIGGTIEIVGDNFVLDGEPFYILSGSIHYFRTPSQYWRDRLLKARAAGLNAISTYVEWSFHEPEEREYRFEGDHNLAKFIETAAELGLLVLLRVGPYICAERDLVRYRNFKLSFHVHFLPQGGLPYWLLSKYPHIQLRTTDEDFIAETRTWLEKLFGHVKELLYGYGNGGPIILVQIENEYGSYGNDMVYKKKIRDIFEEHVGTNALLYTTDGYEAEYLGGGFVPGTVTTLDCGPGDDLKEAFTILQRYMHEGPLMNSEYYAGWLTHWGERFSITDTKEIVEGLDFMLKSNKSINFYMFHGGSNFGFSSGANINYKPHITSYDYDAPLSEAGDMTAKYFAIRELIIKYYPDVKNITPPKPSPKAAYGNVKFSCGVNLLSAEGRSQLGKKYPDVTGHKLPTFEHLRQRGGLMLYETTLEGVNGTLQIKEPRDRIYVFIDKEYKGLIDRENKRYNVNLTVKRGSYLSLLVENQGRINYDYHELDFKGILGNVTYNIKILDGEWSISGYPLEHLQSGSSVFRCENIERGPVLYEEILTLPNDRLPLETYLNTAGWQKGYAWVNGHGLGRYWASRGPQLTLYVPGVWLQQGNNTLQILELEQPPKNLTISFIDHPILNSTGTIIVSVNKTVKNMSL